MQLEKDDESVTSGLCDIAEVFAKHFNSEENIDDITYFCSRTQNVIVNIKISTVWQTYQFELF